MTQTAEKFLKDVEINLPVYRDEDEWTVDISRIYLWSLELEENGRFRVAYSSMWDSFLSQLRDWSNVILVAPLDANSLAKIAHGLCDNLLVSNAHQY